MLTSTETRHIALRVDAGHRVIVLANRAPFRYEVGLDGRPSIIRTASGVVTALEPLLEERGGVWVSSAARDEAGACATGRYGSYGLPGSRYRVRSVPIDEREYRGFYHGFANEGLWPLCHAVDVQPQFRPADYGAYCAANAKLVEAVVQESGGEAPIVLVQDYHVALAPRLLRRRLPASRIVSFWHIPWPRATVFMRCPWASELVQGLLGSDTVAFQTAEDCAHFLESVEALTAAKVNRISSTVRLAGRTTTVRAYPVGVAWRHTVARGTPSVADCREQVFRALGVSAETRLVVGVDRLDYTKGIEEKLLAIEQLLETEPAQRGKVVLAQIAEPSRDTLPAYRALRERVTNTAQRINDRFGSGSDRPIVLLERHHSKEEVDTVYRAADVCYVGSLRDGMNLVAKEFVCARNDERGVLVLSRFAGAARQLHAAVEVDPYDPAGSATALSRGLQMPVAEQVSRMRALRAIVAAFDADWWGRQMIREAMSSDTFTRTRAVVHEQGMRTAR
ncbi:MAG: trehalose-6-phosphate synthase [Vicinamibacterales bacterium]